MGVKLLDAFLHSKAGLLLWHRIMYWVMTTGSRSSSPFLLMFLWFGSAPHWPSYLSNNVKTLSSKHFCFSCSNNDRPQNVSQLQPEPLTCFKCWEGFEFVADAASWTAAVDGLVLLHRQYCNYPLKTPARTTFEKLSWETCRLGFKQHSRIHPSNAANSYLKMFVFPNHTGLESLQTSMHRDNLHTFINQQQQRGCWCHEAV